MLVDFKTWTEIQDWKFDRAQEIKGLKRVFNHVENMREYKSLLNFEMALFYQEKAVECLTTLYYVDIISTTRHMLLSKAIINEYFGKDGK